MVRLSPEQEREARGLLYASFGGGVALFTGLVIGKLWSTKDAPIAAAIPVGIAFVVGAAALALGIGRMAKWTRMAPVAIAIVALPAAVLAGALVRKIHVRDVALAHRDAVAAALWPVCTGAGVAAAAPLADIARGMRPIAFFEHGAGDRWEPEPRWFPREVADAQLVGCIVGRDAKQNCIIDIREARTAKSVGRVNDCWRGAVAAFVEPAERAP